MSELYEKTQRESALGPVYFSHGQIDTVGRYLHWHLVGQPKNRENCDILLDSGHNFPDFQNAVLEMLENRKRGV